MSFAAIGMLSLCLACGSAYGQLPGQAVPNRAAAQQSHLSSNLGATQALQRTLNLIRSSKSVAAITPVSMQRAFGVQVKSVGPQQFGYGQRLPGDWTFGVMREDVSGAGRVDLTFSPLPGTQAALAEICELDFAHFTAELEAMGFARRSYYGEHNRWISDIFERPGMQVEVYPEGMGTNNGNPTDRTCVKMVLIQ